MSTRTILASFYTESEANQARDKVQSLGAEAAEVDSLHPSGQPDRTLEAYAISGKIPSLANLTLHTSVSSRDAGVLLAADPSASGLATPDIDDPVTGRNFLLTVICPEPLVDQAVDIIKQCNGYT